MLFNESYPDEVPQVVCLDRVYHPNIDPVDCADEALDGNVCVSLLDEWESNMDLDHITMAILFLMYNPCVEDALSPYFDGSELEGEVFETNVRKTLRGESLDGSSWPCLLVSGSDDDDAGGASDTAGADSRVQDNKSEQPEDGCSFADATETFTSDVTEPESSQQPATDLDKDLESLPSTTVCDENATKLSNKDSEDSAVKLSKIEAVFNRQNAVLTDLTIDVNPKGFHVIDADGSSLNRNTCISGSNPARVSGLFCGGLRRVGLGVKALFSNFWREDGAFQTLGCSSSGSFASHSDSDVD